MPISQCNRYLPHGSIQQNITHAAAFGIQNFVDDWSDNVLNEKTVPKDVPEIEFLCRFLIRLSRGRFSPWEARGFYPGVRKPRKAGLSRNTAFNKLPDRRDVDHAILPRRLFCEQERFARLQPCA